MNRDGWIANAISAKISSKSSPSMRPPPSDSVAAMMAWSSMSLVRPIRLSRFREAPTIPLVVLGALAFTAGACRSAQCADGLEPYEGRCTERSCGTCGTHELCDTSASPAECRCAPGYGGDPCTFTGLILDPGFRGLEDPNTGDPFWFDEGGKGADVDVLAPGDRDRGEGALDIDESVIRNAGTLTQIVEMPSYDLAEPLLVEVHYKAECVDGLAVGFNRSWKRLPPTGSSWTPETFCLGEGGYGEAPNGGPVHVRLSASELLADCEDELSKPVLRIDQFTIRPADAVECPEPGTVLNGAADVGSSEWRKLVDGDVEAGLVAGVGREGGSGSGARLYREAGATGRATISTQISVPLPASVTSPALAFWWRGTTGKLFEVEMGTLVSLEDRGRQVDTLIGTVNTEVPGDVGENYVYCLPPWTHGSVLDLSFSLPEDVTAEPVELVVDAVTIIPDEEDCGSDEGLLDPGFDSAPNRWFGASLGSNSELVLVQEQGGRAGAGDGVLELAYWTSDAETAMETYVLVPEPKGGEGPAVTFYSRSPAPPSTELKWRVGLSGLPTGAVQTSVDWELNEEACLPAQWAGRWFRFQVGVGRPPASGGPIEQESIFLDDFSLGTSASCPAQ